MKNIFIFVLLTSGVYKTISHEVRNSTLPYKAPIMGTVEEKNKLRTCTGKYSHLLVSQKLVAS